MARKRDSGQFGVTCTYGSSPTTFRVPMTESVTGKGAAMTRIFSIDTGCDHSGWVLTDGLDLLRCENECQNDHVLGTLATEQWDVLLIEEITVAYASPGKGKGRGTVGKTVFRTQFWAGVFFQHALTVAPERPVHLIARSDVARYFRPAERRKGKSRRPTMANDSEVIAAVKTRYAATGGGANPVIGTSRQPGPLRGLSGHCWQALGNTVYFLENS